MDWDQLRIFHAAAEAGQMTLFGGNGGAAKIDVSLLRPAKEIKAVDSRELLDWEKELIGVYLTEHPLERRLAELKDVVTARSNELDNTWNGKPITLAGMVAGLRTTNTKKGQPMAFVTLEDLDGKVDLVMFPKVWAAHRENVQVNQIIVVRGTVQAEGESISILANSVQTRLTVAQDASQARQIPMPPDDDGFWPPDEFDYAPEMNGDFAGPARVKLAWTPSAAESVPPPPDDEDDYLSQEAVAEDTPTRPDPAAIDEAL